MTVELVRAAVGDKAVLRQLLPLDAIAAADPEWGAGLLGDKAHSMHSLLCGDRPASGSLPR